QLGYAPAGRGFAEYLRAKKRSLADAQVAGLMRRDGSDFFAERLVIPIRDERGQPLAFTARAVRQDEQRKYINSPETPAYIKGRVIFGLDLAKDEIARRGHAVLMEGQFDVITAHHFEAGVSQDTVNFNPANANQVEMVAARLREWIGQFPEGLRAGYAEVAERQTAISRHLLLREPEKKAPTLPRFNGLEIRIAGKKLTVGRYLLQLLAVNPAAFDRIRTKIAPDELDEEDRGIYVRMLETYERLGPSGIEEELNDYSPEEQDLIRRA